MTACSENIVYGAASGVCVCDALARRGSVSKYLVPRVWNRLSRLTRVPISCVCTACEERPVLGEVRGDGLFDEIVLYLKIS